MFKCFKNVLVFFLCPVSLFMCICIDVLVNVCMCLFVHLCMSCVALCRVGVMHAAVKQVDNWHHGQALSSLK